MSVEQLSVEQLSVATLAPAPPYTITEVPVSHPAFQFVLADLQQEYHKRYWDVLTPDELSSEISVYGAEEFAAPYGTALVVFVGDEPVAAGAFRLRLEPELGRADLLADATVRTLEGEPAEPTAELKRIWTSAAHRRQGWARIVLDALEHRARCLGYRRIYLTTGPRQPEAAGLYLSHGYRPLFPDPPEDELEPRPFEKYLAV